MLSDSLGKGSRLSDRWPVHLTAVALLVGMLVALASLARDHDQHVAFLRGRMWALGVPEPAVDDAVQDVLEVLLRRIDDYDDRYSLRQWMSGVARKIAKRHREKGAPGQVIDLLAGAHSDPERTVFNREVADFIGGLA